MPFLRITIAITLFSILAIGQKPPAPLTKHDACASRFTSSVVRIEAGGESLGSGFIVSPDGFILTAGHVVQDSQGRPFSEVEVVLPDGTSPFADVIPPSPEAYAEDFALLHVATKHELPFLELGTTAAVETAQDISMIGFPFSGSLRQSS